MNNPERVYDEEFEIEAPSNDSKESANSHIMKFKVADNVDVKKLHAALQSGNDLSASFNVRDFGYKASSRELWIEVVAADLNDTVERSRELLELFLRVSQEAAQNDEPQDPEGGGEGAESENEDESPAEEADSRTFRVDQRSEESQVTTRTTRRGRKLSPIRMVTAETELSPQSGDTLPAPNFRRASDSDHSSVA